MAFEIICFGSTDMWKQYGYKSRHKGAVKNSYQHVLGFIESNEHRVNSELAVRRDWLTVWIPQLFCFSSSLRKHMTRHKQITDTIINTGIQKAKNTASVIYNSQQYYSNYQNYLSWFMTSLILSLPRHNLDFRHRRCPGRWTVMIRYCL